MAAAHAFPHLDAEVQSLLDVGCRDGSDLSHSHFSGVRWRCGIDIDEAAIMRGREQHSDLTLRVGRAEALPFASHSFDALMSRGTVPYTHIPTALGEFHRTLKPGGRLYLTVHDWRMALGWLQIALQERAPKRAADLTCIFILSAVYALSGYCIARPWNGRFETIQTAVRLRKELERAGFEVRRIQRTEKHFEVEAVAVQH